MKLLFDQGPPVLLRTHLQHHAVEAAYDRGWSGLKNGDPLTRAGAEGFNALVTTDQNLRHQQNLAGGKIGVVVLMTTSWPRIRGRIDSVGTPLPERIVAMLDGHQFCRQICCSLRRQTIKS